MVFSPEDAITSPIPIVAKVGRAKAYLVALCAKLFPLKPGIILKNSLVRSALAWLASSLAFWPAISFCDSGLRSILRLIRLSDLLMLLLGLPSPPSVSKPPFKLSLFSVGFTSKGTVVNIFPL